MDDESHFPAKLVIVPTVFFQYRMVRPIQPERNASFAGVSRIFFR